MASTSKQKDQTGEVTPREGKKYTRFPRLSIADVVEFPGAIIKEGCTLKRDRLCLILKRSTSSGQTNLALAAARSYGLIAKEQGGFFDVTDLGKRACSADEKTRRDAFAEANNSVDQFRVFVDKFAEKRVPSAAVGADHLEHAMALNPQEAPIFYDVVMANARDAGLVEELAGGDILRRVPASPTEEPEPTAEIQDAGTGTVAPQQPVAPAMGPNSGGQSLEMHFNVQIHLPESTDPEVYDAIFRSIKNNLLGS